nr:melanocyte-stimulating hormone receptor-like [Crassostrea gigas]
MWLQKLTDMNLSTTENSTSYFDDIKECDLLIGNNTFLTVLLYNNETFFRISFSDMTGGNVVLCVCLFITCLGIVGNMVTVAKIVNSPALHTPTFAVIGCLALADFFSVIFFGLVYFTNVLKLVNDRVFKIFPHTFYFSSTSHVLLLCSVRYLLTVYPLQSRRYLTVTSMLLCSLSLWFMCSLIAVVLYVSNGFACVHASIIRGLCSVIMLTIVSSIMVTLHLKKIKVMKRLFASNTHQQARSNMNLVVTVIFIIFAAFHISMIVLYFYEFILVVQPRDVCNDQVYKYLFITTALTTCLNYSCNPYILFWSFIFCKRR